MKYTIGIDAGGTKTECALVSEDLKVVQSIKGEGFNLSVHGIQAGYKVVRNLLEELGLYSLNKTSISRICIAAAGAGRKELKTAFVELLTNSLKDQYSFEKIKVITDAEAALEGAFSGEEGFILIAGTGSILYGKDNKGTAFRCGGYGRLLGDQGSGYSIGRKAFNYLAEVIDGIEAAGELSTELTNKFRINDLDNLISLVNTPSFNLADAALIVLNAAANKDIMALKIINEEASSLSKLIVGMMKKTGHKDLRIALCGSLIANDNIYSETLLMKIAADYPAIIINKPKYPPAVGAAISVIKEI